VVAAEGYEVVEGVRTASSERDDVVDGQSAAASALVAVDASAVAGSRLRSSVLPREGVAGAGGGAGGASALRLRPFVLAQAVGAFAAASAGEFVAAAACAADAQEWAHSVADLEGARTLGLAGGRRSPVDVSVREHLHVKGRRSAAPLVSRFDGNRDTSRCFDVPRFRHVRPDVAAEERPGVPGAPKLNHPGRVLNSRQELSNDMGRTWTAEVT
jgi:hypothetical protein